MNLASPQNQEEYDNLRNLLRNSTAEWGHVIIAGYRSEEDKKTWVTSDNKIKYSIDWYFDEPNNADGQENCIGEV